MPKTSLPDFEDLMELAEEIGKLDTKISKLKNMLEHLKALITQQVTMDKKFFINDKPPSMSYITSHFHVLGTSPDVSETLLDIKEDLAKSTGELQAKKNQFVVMRDMIKVWQTESANERITLL